MISLLDAIFIGIALLFVVASSALASSVINRRILRNMERRLAAMESMDEDVRHTKGNMRAMRQALDLFLKRERAGEPSDPS